MKILPLLLTFFCVQLSFAQSLVINEVSQGSSFAKEYVELLVIPDPSQPVSCTEILPCLDLRGWIFDDNNGYFTGGPATGVGIAAGACRFSNDLFWSCVPVGTIILIYNDNDFDGGVIPSADTDLLDGDCDLSIPITSSLFERVDSPLIPNSGDMSYPTLANDWVSGGIWSQIGMSNTNDSFQIYDPSNMAAPVHGVSWGNNSTNNIIFFAGSAAGNVFYATNTVDCDFADQANWVSGSTASGASDEQTAGVYNNSLNQSCIEALNNNCLNPMIASAISTDEVCNCEATAYAEDPITDTSFTVGSDGNYTYEWFDNSTPFNSLGTGPTLTDLCAGVYNLIVTSGTGCVDTASVTIAPSNSAMITGNAPICSGSTLQLTGSGPDGANPWSSDTPAVATIDINGLVTGIIGGTSIITYTDINGCTDTTLITVNQTPIIDPIGPLAVCDSLELPAITGTLTGIESYYSGPGGTGTAYTAGDWITSSITLYAYDSTATAPICFDEETLVITINSALITGNAPICSGSTLQLTGSGTAAFSSPWTSATPATATVDDFGIVTGVMAGTSIITYTNANNCADTVTVSVIPLPVLTVQDTAICSPNTVDLTDPTYWSTDIGIITYFEANGTTPLADATAVGAGTYVLSADSLGCITTATVVVIVIPLPILTVQDTTTCSPNTVSLIDFTYWSTDIGVITYFESDGTTVVGDATAVGAGTYILSSNNLGCIASAPVVVTVNASPVIAATGLDPALCNGVNGEIEVTLSSGQTSLGVLDWTGTASGSNGSADITADSPDIIGLGAGSYNVTFTDVNGCVSNTELIGLNNPFAPIIDPISSIVSCADYDLVLANVTGTNITAALTFYALTGGPLVVGQQVINDQTFTAFTDTTIFVYDENGACSSEIQFNITINTTPTLTVQDTTTCSPSTVDLTDGAYWSTDVGTITYFESNGITVVGDETAVGAGTYILSADNAGCITTAPLVVTVNTTPTLSVQDTTTCSPNTIDLTDVTYWSSDVGTITYFESDGTTLVLDATAVGAGAYILSADNAGCITTAPVVVTVNTTPTLSVQDTTTCSPNTIDLTDFTYWSTDVGTITYFESNGTTLVGDATAVGAGTYILSADNAGCITTAPVVLTVTPLPVLTVQDTTTCSPNTINLTDPTYWSTGVGTITYFESDGTTVVGDETIVGAGTYILSADNAGCVTTAPVVVTVTPLPVLMVQDTAICSLNTIDLTDVTYWSTDVGTITYFESDGTTLVGDATAVGSGTYILSAENAGCITTAPVVVTLTPLPVLMVQDTTTCSPNTIDLTDVTIWSTDVGTITYFELDGTTVVGDATAVGAGTYILSADNLGCFTTASVIITVNPLPALIVQDTTTCSPNTVDLTDATYWSTDLGTITFFESDGTTVVGDATAVGAGTYILIADNAGCITTAPVVVTVNTTPTLSVQDTTTCSPNTIDLTNVTYWSTDVGTITYFESNGTTLVGDATAVGSGTYILSADNAGCITTALVVVTVNTTPTLTVQDTTTCSPNTVDLSDATFWSTDLGTITYFESDGTTLVGDATAAGAGTYVLSADNAGCISAALIVVTINTTPTLSVLDTLTCPLNLIDLTDVTYWSTDAGTITYFESDGTTLVTDASAVGAGTYILSADNAGCIVTAPVVVTINTTPILTVQDTTTCAPNIVNLTDVTYWSTDVGTISYFESDGVTPILNATIVGAGTYVLSANNFGCIAVANVTVTVKITPTLTLVDPPAVCSPLTVDITLGAVSSTDVGAMLYYSDLAMTMLVPDATAVGGGTYYVEATYLGCSKSGPVTVVVVTTPEIFPLLEVIECDSFALPIIEGVLLTGAQNYFDATGGPSVANVVTGPITSSTTLFIYDGLSGCSDEETLVITINPLPTLTLVGGGTYCEGDFVSDMLVDVTGTPNFTVDFTLDGVALSASGATSPLSLGNAAGVYIITNITDGNTCTNVVYEIEKIIVNPIPAAPAAGTDVVYCSTVTPDAMTVSGGLGTFTWYSDAGLTSVFGAGITIDPSNTLGEFTYYVTETEFGCESPASEVIITINGCEFIVPTAFTPDGDLMNDDWEILDIDLIYPNNIVYVYNRWGSLLFKSKQGSYDSNRWNGKYNGNLLPVGSYYFIIDYNGKGNDKATGIVSIILNK